MKHNKPNTGEATMDTRRIANRLAAFGLASSLALVTGTALAIPFIQCPGDDLKSDGVTPGHDAVPEPTSPNYDPSVKCMHLIAGDGYVRMADGREVYIFGFGDVTGVDEDKVMSQGMLHATFPAPRIVLEEGQKFYLTLTNVGMVMRPDLFDPHTVHFHGFPNASTIFDGVPDNSISINMGSSLTYFYNIVEPGTYMYHCHVEAAEHMQMGMLGNLYVHAAQDRLPDGTTFANGFVHHTGNHYAYDDQDGSTRYDVEYPIQIGSFDVEFHDADENVQPLPFADMKDDYGMLNGRGYPDTVDPNPVTPPTKNGNFPSQVEDSRIVARQGQRILLRISNLNVTRFYTLRTLGLDMEVIGQGARQLRGPDPDGNGPLLGKNVYYKTNSVTLGGGEAIDVIIDTTGVPPGKYFLYTTNLHYLSNNQEDYGGMMTEIIIN